MKLIEKASKILTKYDYSQVECNHKKFLAFPKSIGTVFKPECFTLRVDKQDKYLAAGFSTGHILLYDLEKEECRLHVRDGERCFEKNRDG